MVQLTPRAPSQGPPSLSGWAAHIVVAEHDGFGGPCGHQPVDQGTALVGLLGIDDLVQHVVRDAVPQLQERSPLREGERESRGWAGLAGEGWEVGPRALQQGLQPPRGGGRGRGSPPHPVLPQGPTEYRFRSWLWIFSLYWTMALRCFKQPRICETPGAQRAGAAAAAGRTEPHPVF